MQNYSVRLGFRVTEKEKAEIEEQSKAFGLPMSDYIRRRILGKKIILPKIKTVDAAAIAELSRQGGLLKKYYTDTQGVNAEQTKKILNKMEEIITALSKELED